MLKLFRRLQTPEESGHTGLENHLKRFSQGKPELEWCYYIETSANLQSAEQRILEWLLRETYDPDGFSQQSFTDKAITVVEIGPRLNFETAWSSTAVSICQSAGIDTVTRIERSLRIGIDRQLSGSQVDQMAEPLHDRMTQTVYPRPLQSLLMKAEPETEPEINLLSEGRTALESINSRLGLAMDDQDLERFYDLFANQLKRNPTATELFQLGQGNSEHSRHGFFKGRLIQDGKDLGANLMSIVKEPWRQHPENSLIAFKDDSSAIKGAEASILVPEKPGTSSAMKPTSPVYHPTLTAETHNFPSGVAPYPGAATGTGGRIRDNQAVGRGGLVVASGAAYCVGKLHHQDLDLPWPVGVDHPANLASPVDILVQASNGASDYGNCFGEPLIYGFVRSFGQTLPEGYSSWFKPIMYTVGAGQIDGRHVDKGAPEAGMQIVQLGGPAYRIGMGGGAASSLMAGENTADLDFNAVQRGNPEMEQRMNRVMRACVELGGDNPIISAHDLGAGGDSNALPEIAYPAGGRIELRQIPIGDSSLSVLEIWGNESQERNALLVWPKDADRLKAICARENCPIAVVGEITGDGRLVLHDAKGDTNPVDLPLEPILGDTQPKEVRINSQEVTLKPLDLAEIELEEALTKVLLDPAVGSKSYLTRKVDRSVTGLIAQQQCVGPNHLPLSDFAVIAQGLFGHSGVALSLGEQPIKGLVDPRAMGRMAVAEALLNLSGAKISRLGDVKCEGNWMWAAKLPGEGVRLKDAAVAMRDFMLSLGIAIDGGKDSLSMAVRDAAGKTIKSPGQLVIAPYAPMPDVSRKVTPDLKAAGNRLLLIDLSGNQARLGGSILAQAYGQLGDQTPDADPRLLRNGFEAIQQLVDQGLIVSLHDRSDGGLITTVLEMAFGGGRGMELSLNGHHELLNTLFSEELGVVIECHPDKQAEVNRVLAQQKLKSEVIGSVTEEQKIRLRFNDQLVLDSPVSELLAVWDKTSYELEKLQANPQCVESERQATLKPEFPKWQLSYKPSKTSEKAAAQTPKVAILREQGTNGDREMAAAFHAAGFEVWDVMMNDLLDKKVSLADFRGLAFPGGFSFGDVLDSAKGWAGKIRFHRELASQFNDFYQRKDTFSFGVCNGCQLMALLGWVPGGQTDETARPRFIRNQSGRFESRFANVTINDSPAIMLKGMAGSTMGVWVAHGEGQAHGVERIDPKLAPIRFANAAGQPTEQYPFNPNGSPDGITALCSPDGRHLAMMPHPERLANQLWQWPWLPEGWDKLEASPWLQMFQNAYDWCRQSTQ